MLMPAALLLAASVVSQASSAPAGAPPAQGITPRQLLDALQSAVADAVVRSERSVVAITRARNPDGEETLAVRGQTPPPIRADAIAIEALDLSNPNYIPLPGDYGSGVVIGSQGQILTAYHVVQSSVRIFVRAPGAEAGFDAEVIAADPRSDLAVIAPRIQPGQAVPHLTPIAIGKSESLRKGSFVLALGNPYHTARDGTPSASWGILSNTTRRIVAPAENDPAIRQMFRYQPTLLQLDAKLNLGMSGGAVVNLDGELVGITTNGGNAEGFDAQAGYAIPLDGMGRRVVEALAAGREAEYGFLGIRLGSTTNEVGGAEPGTPAAEADLQLGDLIVGVNDIPVNETVTLSMALAQVDVGTNVKLKLLRNGSTRETSVFLSKYPVSGEVIATSRPGEWRGLRVDFTSVLNGSTMQDAVLKNMASGLVSIAEIRPGSPAEAAGLRKGVAITKVDGKALRTPAEFLAAVEGKKGAVKLQTPDGEVTVEP